MYRTPKTHELILKGIPDRLRGEIWILFSGTVNEVSLVYMFVRDSLLTIFISIYSIMLVKGATTPLHKIIYGRTVSLRDHSKSISLT